MVFSSVEWGTSKENLKEGNQKREEKRRRDPPPPGIRLRLGQLGGLQQRKKKKRGATTTYTEKEYNNNKRTDGRTDQHLGNGAGSSRAIRWRCDLFFQEGGN